MKNLPLKFHLDIGKMYISHLNIKNTSFLMGITIFRCCITHTYHFRLFLMKGGLLYEETRFQSFKKELLKHKKDMQEILFILLNKSSKGIYILLKKNLVNKMKIFKGPLFLEGLFYSALSNTPSNVLLSNEFPLLYALLFVLAP